MIDPEGDSCMASPSEGSIEELDAMFPEDNEPSATVRTPQPANLQNLQQFSELSPPSSEGPTDSQTLIPDLMDQTNGAKDPGFQGIFGGGSAVDSTQKQLSIADREPGASWNTRKQQDEENRVKENLLDKGFSLSECLWMAILACELIVWQRNSETSTMQRICRMKFSGHSILKLRSGGLFPVDERPKGLGRPRPWKAQ